MKKKLKEFLNKFGYTVSKKNTHSYNDIADEEFWEIYNLCKPYTLTSVERMYALFCATKYIISNHIKGDFIECGVWRGGSTMLIAKILYNRNITDRKIYLFDTFEGMPDASNHDVDFRGTSANELLKPDAQNRGSILCIASLEDVEKNLDLTEYPRENIIYVKGRVEETIPDSVTIDNISLLRLDTDWYESTKHELYHLYPKLALNGILIIDDYGHWQGCRKAVDEYFNEAGIRNMLNRIDYTGRLLVKNFSD